MGHAGHGVGLRAHMGPGRWGEERTGVCRHWAPLSLGADRWGGPGREGWGCRCNLRASKFSTRRELELDPRVLSCQGQAPSSVTVSDGS